MAAEQPRTPPPDAGGATMSRRTLLKAGAGAAAVGAVTTHAGPLEDLSLVGDAEAFAGAAMFIAGAGSLAASAWVTREMGLWGQDAPPEGLTTGALKQQANQTAQTRKSTYYSTFVDNRNILTYLPETALSEAKKQAYNAMNAGKSKSEVQGAAQSAANSHYSTVEKNLLRSWNEAVRELESIRDTISAHPDVSVSSAIIVNPEGGSSSNGLTTTTTSFTLSDGSTIDLKQIDSSAGAYDPTDNPNGDGNYIQVKLFNGDSDHSINYMYADTWHPVWQDIQSQFDQIDSDISTWVDTRYDQYQAGEIDDEDLVSGLDLADTSDVPQAIADLVASNIPVDLDNQITVSMGPETMSGYLATTDQNALSEVAPSDTIDPNATDSNGDPLYETIYIAQDLAEWRYDWTAYDADKSVDGGVVWYTQSPSVIEGFESEKTLFHAIETAAGETTTVTPADFSETTDGSGNTVWEVDLSDKLSTDITDIAKITVSLDTESVYTTTILDESFTVESTANGEPVTMTQNRDPQTDDNYISPGEWDQMQQDQERLIEKYKDAKNSGSPLFGGGIPTLPGLGVVESAVVVLLGIAGLSAASS